MVTRVADEAADIIVLMMLLFPAGGEAVSLVHSGAFRLLVEEVLAVASAVLVAVVHSAVVEPAEDGKSYIKNELIF